MASFDWKKKHCKFCQRQIDHKSHRDQNIPHTKGGKCKTAKGIPGCHETCWWNSGGCPCQRLCSLQKMDQGVIQQQNFMALLRAIKLHDTTG